MLVTVTVAVVLVLVKVTVAEAVTVIETVTVADRWGLRDRSCMSGKRRRHCSLSNDGATLPSTGGAGPGSPGFSAMV